MGALPRCNHPEPRLIDATHIIVDGDAALGQPMVPNGLTLSKIHHAAFDANFIGVDPDYKIHISEALLSTNDGPMFEFGVKALAGRSIRLPPRPGDDPDRDPMRARAVRLRNLFAGQLAAWNELDLPGLEVSSDLLTEECRRTFLAFHAARASALPMRLYWFAHSGVQRQRVVQNLVLWIAVAVGKI